MQADTPLHLPISLAAYPNPLGSGMITKPPDNDIPGRQTNKNISAIIFQYNWRYFYNQKKHRIQASFCYARKLTLFYLFFTGIVHFFLSEITVKMRYFTRTCID